MDQVPLAQFISYTLQSYIAGKNRFGVKCIFMQYKLHNEVFDHSNRMKEKEFFIICISPKFLNFSIFCHQIVILFVSVQYPICLT